MATPQSISQGLAAAKSQAQSISKSLGTLSQAKSAGLSVTPQTSVQQAQQFLGGGGAPSAQGGQLTAPPGFNQAAWEATTPETRARVLANLQSNQEFNVDVPDMFGSDFLDRAFGQPKGIADILKLLGPRPEAPSLLETFQEQRQALGIPSIEQRLNELQDEATRIETAAVVEADKAGDPKGTFGRPHLRTIQAREGRISREAQRSLALLAPQIEAQSRLLSAKNQALSTYMTLANQDFQNANTQWNQKFTQAMQVYNIVSAEEREEKKEAQALLSTIASTYQEAGISFNEVPEATRLKIEELELQAEWPLGLTETSLSIEPEKEIAFTIVSDDKTQASVTYKDGSTKVIPTGLSAQGISSDEKISTIFNEVDAEGGNEVDFAKRLKSEGISRASAAAWFDLNTKLNQTQINSILDEAYEEQKPLTDSTIDQIAEQLAKNIGTDTGFSSFRSLGAHLRQNKTVKVNKEVRELSDEEVQKLITKVNEKRGFIRNPFDPL